MVSGFRPVLLPRRDMDGRTRLVPHNLVTAWYWVEGGATPRPVRLADLRRRAREGEYHPEVLAALDSDRDGRVGGRRSAIWITPEKVEAVRQRLLAVGVDGPADRRRRFSRTACTTASGPARWATRECQTCHAADSRLSEPFTLASYAPGGVLPKLVGDSGGRAGRHDRRSGRRRADSSSPARGRPAVRAGPRPLGVGQCVGMAVPAGRGLGGVRPRRAAVRYGDEVASRLSSQQCDGLRPDSSWRQSPDVMAGERTPTRLRSVLALRTHLALVQAAVILLLILTGA